MISSPSPTSQPQPQLPEQKTQEEKKDPYRRPRAGQSPAAVFVKNLLRPIFKGLYYVFHAMGRHKLVTLVMLLLLLGSAIGANFAVTREWPFGIGNDPFNFHVRGGGNGGGDQVKNWMYALRDGNLAALELLDKDMPQPPSAQQLQQYISQYSQAQGHLSWKAINVEGVAQQTDTSVDSFVEVDLSANGPGGPVGGYMIWHFVTVQGQTGEVLFSVTLIDFRPSLQ
ncbi:MAG TPA: hypothetical protein VFA09_09070 [Ktedonobacteraceae bacterium]|nr:hypothetical protein [Ktedonobacteraceae bacterium]